MKRYCYTLDLVEDEKLIEEYINHHSDVWPEIQKSIIDSGILLMEIYLIGNRLFMITDVDDFFSLEKRASIDNSKVQEWESLMWKYQKAVPFAKEGEKWVLMDRIYQLKKSI